MASRPATECAHWTELTTRLREAATFASIRATLSWDQETVMPRQAAPFRADELALVATMEHERLTHPRLLELIARCEADRELSADPAVAADLREARRDFERASKLPTELVRELTKLSSEAIEAWKEARKRSDFAAFAPYLSRQVELNRKKAECYGAPPGGELYDALLDEYEPGMTAAELTRIFTPLRAVLAPFIAGLTSAARKPSDGPSRALIPIARQQEFCRLVAERVGFDFDAGRLDESTHPFTEGLAPGDTRITSRYADDRFTDALGSTLHEAGHGLYEQGLPKSSFHGQPRAQAAGLGLHESQSRLWENQVGRSRAFWTWAAGEAKRVLGAPVAQFSAEQCFESVNRVTPSLIRVDSDEATYNLHIMLRFEIEKALVRGDLAVADVPERWNERVRQDLGLTVPEDRVGCLQDIHWSAGAIGYFPTYTLGTLYAAQLWEALAREVATVDADMARGDFSQVLAWLRRNVHAHGRRYRSAELCEKVTGKPLAHEAMMTHLRSKLEPLYGVS